MTRIAGQTCRSNLDIADSGSKSRKADSHGDSRAQRRGVAFGIISRSRRARLLGAVAVPVVAMGLTTSGLGRAGHSGGLVLVLVLVVLLVGASGSRTVTVPMVTMRLAANRLGRAGDSGGGSVVVLILSQRRRGTVAVPVVTVRFAANRLGWAGHKRSDGRSQIGRRGRGRAVTVPGIDQ